MLPRIKVPLPVRGDAYTVADPLTSPKAIERSIYNGTFRLSPKDVFSFAKNDNILFYGLTDYLAENLLDPVTVQDVLNSERFMRDAHAFGYGLPFDREMWMRAIKEFNGRLPVTIEAVPLGATIFPNEPFLQVTSLSKGYGEIAALLEAVLLGQVSIASSALTMRRQLLAAMEEYVREDEPELDDAAVRFKASIMIHDFGMCAHANQYESAMLGRAHLLVFPGTDTFNAAYEAWQLAHCKPVGTSIAALAHRSVQSFPDQLSCFLNAAAKAIQSAGNNGPAIVSLVSDCYNFDATIEGDLKTTCEKYPQLVAVARPDSGDYVANVLKIVTEAKNAGFYTVQKNGRIAMTTRRFIQGDSMDWNKMVNVMEALKANGFSPVNCGIFGVGGWLRNTPTRDTLSAAYKLSAIGEDQEPVVKLSHTRAKMSVPGPVHVLRNTEYDAPTVYFEDEAAKGDNILVSYYDGRLVSPFEEPCGEDFLSVKRRVLTDFDNSQKPTQVLSPRIIQVQDATFAKYNRSREDFSS